MRSRILACLLAAFSVLEAGCAQGDHQPSRIQINQVRVGFPAATQPGEPLDERNQPNLFKPGAWAPVYVDLTPEPDGLDNPSTEKGQVVYQVAVETGDS